MRRSPHPLDRIRGRLFEPRADPRRSHGQGFRGPSVFAPTLVFWKVGTYVPLLDIESSKLLFPEYVYMIVASAFIRWMELEQVSLTLGIRNSIRASAGPGATAAERPALASGDRLLTVAPAFKGILASDGAVPGRLRSEFDVNHCFWSKA